MSEKPTGTEHSYRDFSQELANLPHLLVIAYLSEVQRRGFFQGRDCALVFFTCVFKLCTQIPLRTLTRSRMTGVGDAREVSVEKMDE